MHPIIILLIGMVVVIGAVLGLRLHAFLALLAAALVVGILTPETVRQRYLIDERAVEVLESAGEEDRLLLKGLATPSVRPGMVYLVLRPVEQELRQAGLLRVEQLTTLSAAMPQSASDLQDPDEPVAVARLVEGSSVEPADIVIHPLALQSALSASRVTVGERIAEAFGDTCAQIGILIAMAAIIGKCLLDSGAADRIVRAALKVCGERGAPLAFLGSGFLLGIPVFFDTVFYLMIPLGKALHMRTARNYLLYVLTIVAGATMAHSLVPPTPGPLFVAEQLDVDLGLMIIAGCLVGLCASTAGFLFAWLANARLAVPLRETPDFLMKDLQALAARQESELPPLSLSLLPILLPVVLIAGHTVVETAEWQLGRAADEALRALGNKNIALIIAAAIAMGLLVWQRRSSLKDLAASVQAALASGGIIILITAAGGAFGEALQQTGIARLIRQLPDVGPMLIIVLAFLITAAVRTAQGSATVAMITAAGILYPMVDQISFHPVYLALAIGCGSKPISWMNDSGFWVICKMSGMTESEGLRSVTPMSILMGLAGLAATLVGATLWPLK